MSTSFGQDFLIPFGAGLAAGGFFTIIISLIIFFLNSRSRANKEQEKVFIGKVIGGLMSDVNDLFVAYRLGNLVFEEMERECRELLSKISLELRDNMSIINSGYVSVIDRYTEDKASALIAMKEDLTNRRPQPQTQDMSVAPNDPLNSAFASAPNQFTETAPVAPTEIAPVDEQNTTDFESFEIKEAAPSPVAQPSIPSLPPAPITQSGDSFADFASSIEESMSGSDSIFGESNGALPPVPAPETPPAPVAQPVFQTPPPAPVSQPVFQTPPPAPVAQPAFQTPPPAPVAQPVFQTPPPAPVSQPVFQTPPPAPVSQPVFQTPPPAPSQEYKQNLPHQQNNFSVHGSSLDVEATQEFNLNDIMNGGVDAIPPQNNDSSMVSGDDVASQLDNFFSN